MTLKILFDKIFTSEKILTFKALKKTSPRLALGLPCREPWGLAPWGLTVRKFLWNLIMGLCPIWPKGPRDSFRIPKLFRIISILLISLKKLFCFIIILFLCKINEAYFIP
jgi:hypothetical protein